MSLSLDQQKLIEDIEKLNRFIEVSGVMLGVKLAVCKRTEAYKTAGFDEWYQFYEHLGRTKQQISKLLKVGEWALENGTRADTLENLQYTKLEAAIRAFPNKEHNYIIAAAQTNTLKELESEGKESKYGVCEDHEPITICKKCNKRL